MRSSFTDTAIEIGKRAAIGAASAEVMCGIFSALGASRPISLVTVALLGAVGGAIHAALRP